MPDLGRAVRSWEEWDRGMRSGDPRALDALSRLLLAIAAPRYGKSYELTSREIEVVREIANGATIRETGRALFIEESTVKHHLKRIYLKLGAKNRTHAVAIALRTGVIE